MADRRRVFPACGDRRRSCVPGNPGSWSVRKGVSMRLGTAIVLLALGAILTFALRVDVSGVDLQVVGWILMVGGARGPVLQVAVWRPRSRRRLTQPEGYPAPAPGTVQRTT